VISMGARRPANQSLLQIVPQGVVYRDGVITANYGRVGLISSPTLPKTVDGHRCAA
jgi:hypothetical protein